MGEPGRFIWHELATGDVEHAKSFYAKLLGWRYEIMEGGAGPYTVIHAGDAGIGGMVPSREGAPPQWAAYVTVADVDAAAERGSAAGGTVVIPPTPIPTIGRFALIADPSGATIMPFLPEGPDQGEPDGPPPRGAVCWNELYTHGADAALKFYQAVFGWGHGTMDMGPSGTYHLFKRAGKDVGGMMEMTREQMPKSSWMPYFVVDDVDASLAEALAMGAVKHMGPHEVPGVGRFAIISDPTGAALGIFKG
jgi:predicted enzyme related to lactoylglutathione lyase